MRIAGKAPVAVAWSALLLATVGLGGCASSADPSSSRTTPTPAASSAPAPSPDASPGTRTPTSTATPSAAAGREIVITVTGGKVQPAPGRVPLPAGTLVRLVVTSDVADEIHVHGYDLEEALAPGKPTTLEFMADQSGLFEVEMHETGKILTSLVVR